MTFFILGGPWLQSCTPLKWSGLWLEAYCGLPNAVLSSLNFALCDPTATISVNNGRLVCSALGPEIIGERYAYTR